MGKIIMSQISFAGAETGIDVILKAHMGSWRGAGPLDVYARVLESHTLVGRGFVVIQIPRHLYSDVETAFRETA